MSVYSVTVLILIAFFIDKVDSSIGNIASSDIQTEVVSVYVMQDDVAQTIENVRDYKFGVIPTIDKENTD